MIQLLPCSLFNKGQRKRVWAPSDDTEGVWTVLCGRTYWGTLVLWIGMMRYCSQSTRVVHNVSYYLQFCFFCPSSPLSCCFFLAHKSIDEWRLTVEEVGDKNTHRGQKAIYLYQLELILTDKGRREDRWKGISISPSLAVFRYLPRLQSPLSWSVTPTLENTRFSA